jgi:hypothetical protein
MKTWLIWWLIGVAFTLPNFITVFYGAAQWIITGAFPPIKLSTAIKNLILVIIGVMFMVISAFVSAFSK